MGTLLLGTLLLLNLVLLALVAGIFRRLSHASQAAEITGLTRESIALRESLSQRFTAATADMAMRLESTKGDLRQGVTDRLAEGFKEIRNSVEAQLTSGRREQTQDLRAARTEMTSSLALTTAQLKAEIDNFNQSTAQSLEAIRDRVDAKLLAITDQVQAKLDQNIKEGFAQFEKVQQHLKAAEEQLREVGALGHSINDLNNLLKLPHLRGTFGEASLERLLSDFLPAHMFEIQSSPGEGGGRAPMDSGAPMGLGAVAAIETAFPTWPERFGEQLPSALRGLRTFVVRAGTGGAVRAAVSRASGRRARSRSP